MAFFKNTILTTIFLYISFIRFANSTDIICGENKRIINFPTLDKSVGDAERTLCFQYLGHLQKKLNSDGTHFETLTEYSHHLQSI